MSENIQNFWQFVQDNVAKLETESSMTNYILDQLQSLLLKINNDLVLDIKPTIIKMKNLNLGLDQKYLKYTKKMIICRYNLEFSDRNSNNSDLLQQLLTASEEYNIPYGWCVVSGITPKFNNDKKTTDNIFVPFKSTFIGVSSWKYIVNNLDNDKLDVIILLNSDITNLVKTQDDVYLLNTNFIEWLEQLLGEYHVKNTIESFTLVPIIALDQESKTIPKDGCYFISDILQRLPPSKKCSLCFISEHNATFGLHKYSNLLEYPYIDDIFCINCFELAKQFKPMYIKFKSDLSEHII